MQLRKLDTLNSAIALRDAPSALRAIRTLLKRGDAGPAWRVNLRKLARVIETDSPRFNIFARKGNIKLPFLAFSALPGRQFCPGAGDCLRWCYSFKAWRYPAAYARQAQNTWLLGSDAGREAIAQALAMRRNQGRTLRLYVDGDFRHAGDVQFWWEALRANPSIQAYGYSKSLQLLTQCHADGITAPDNYRLNISGGHRYGADTVARASALPFARGTFDGIDIGRKVTSAMHGTRAVNEALREAFGARAFTCPGKCGSCTPKGHACGSDRFKGIPIIIAVH